MRNKGGRDQLFFRRGRAGFSAVLKLLCFLCLAVLIFSSFESQLLAVEYCSYTESTSHIRLTVNYTGDKAGYAITTGDFNNDGYMDVAASAPWGFTYSQGRVYITWGISPNGWPVTRTQMDYSGDSGAENSTIVGAASGDRLGISLATGDINGDGKNDLIVAASPSSGTNGIVYIFLNGFSFGETTNLASTNPSCKIINIAGGNWSSPYGLTITTADVYKDSGNCKDIIIGAPNYNSSAGAIYVIPGKTSIGSGTTEIDASKFTANFNATTVIRMKGVTAGDRLGSSIAAGDIIQTPDGNDNSLADVISGARTYSSSKGRVYIVPGRASSAWSFADASIDSVPGLKTVTGISAGDQCGYSIAAGKLRGSSKDDLAIGAPYADSAGDARSDAGEVYVLFGSNSFSNIDLGTTNPDSIIYGKAAGELLGTALLIADINNDGYADLHMGAIHGGKADGGGTAGRHYTFYGLSSLLSSYDLNETVPFNLAFITYTHTTSGYDYGFSFASALMTADSAAELLVGAPGEGGSGTVTVLYGSRSPNGPTMTQATTPTSNTTLNVQWTFSDPDSGDTQKYYQVQTAKDINFTQSLDESSFTKSNANSQNMVLNAGEGTYYYRTRTADHRSWGPWGTPKSVLLDLGPPSASIVINPVSPVTLGNVSVELTPSEALIATPTLSFTPQGQSPVNVTLTPSGGKYVGTMTITNDMNDGTATFSWLGYDLANNPGTSITSGGSFVIDKTGPSISISMASPVKAGSYTVTITANENLSSITYLRFTPQGGSPVDVTGISGSGTNWSGTATITSGMNNGTATFSWSGKDMVNNTGTTITSGSTFVIDTVGPTCVLSYQYNPAKAGNNKITATFNENIVTTPSISINQQGSVDISNASMSATADPKVWEYTYTVNTHNGSEYIDGVATCSISGAQDQAGNSNQAASNNTFTIDTIPPTASFSTNPLPPLGITTVTVTLTVSNGDSLASAPTAYINFYGGGSKQISNWTGGGTSWSGTVTIEASDASGNATFTWSGTDLAGNTGTTVTGGSPVNVDTLPPSCNLSYQYNPATVGPNKITATFSETIVTTPKIKIDQQGTEDIDPPVNMTATSDPKVWEYTYTVNKDNGGAYRDGVATVTITNGKDAAGNPNAEATNNAFSIDTTGPSAAITLNPSSPVKPGNVTVNLVTDGVCNGTPTLSFTTNGGGGPYSITLSPVSGTQFQGTMTITSDMAEGTATFSYSGKDELNNESTTITSGSTFVIDKTPPTASITLNPPSPVGAGNVTVNLTSSENLQAAPYLTYTPNGGSPIQVIMSGSGTSWSGTMTIEGSTPNGTATFSYSGTDIAGNTGTTITSGGTFTIDTSGPSCTISLSGASVGTVGPPAFVSEGDVLVTLVASEPLIEAPTVTYTPNGGSPVPVVMNGSGTTWTGTMTITGSTGDGVATFSFSGKDMTNNPGTGITSGGTFTIDTIDPTCELSYNKSSPVPAGPMLITATFSENIPNLTGKKPYISIDQPGTADVNNVAMNPTGPDPINVYSYTYTISTANGTTWIDGLTTVTISGAKDAAGNPCQAATNNTFTTDTTKPTATITYVHTPAMSGPKYTVGDMEIRVQFNENITTTPKIKITGVTGLGVPSSYVNLTNNGSQKDWKYTYTIYKHGTVNGGVTSSDGTATVSLTNAYDAANNGFTDPATNNTYIVETVGPVPTLTYSRNPANQGNVIITATMNKSCASGKDPKIAIDQAGTNDLSPTFMTVVPGSDRKQWTYTYYVNAPNPPLNVDGTASVTISNCEDELGNPVEAPVNGNLVIDNVGPDATFSYSADPAPAGFMTITLTITEACPTTPKISIDQPGTIDISNEPMTKQDTQGKIWTYIYEVHEATESIYIDGWATCSVTDVTDLAGNNLVNLFSNQFEISTRGPTCDITYNPPSEAKKAGSLTITATYRNGDPGFIPSISINQPGTIDIVSEPMTKVTDDIYTYQYTVMAETGDTYKDGEAIVSISASNIKSGNTFIIDTKPPTITVSYDKPSPVGIGNLLITLTYSEKPYMRPPDITLSKSSEPGSPSWTLPYLLTTRQSDTVYTYNFPITDTAGVGIVTVTIASQQGLMDVALNQGNQPSNNTFTIDTSALTCTLSYQKNPAKAGTNRITATFNKSVKDSPVPTISIDQQGLVDDLNKQMTKVSATEYRYDYTVVTHTDPATNDYKDGVATVSITNVQDQAGNTLQSNNISNKTFVIDTTPPSGTLTYDSTPAKLGPLLITLTLSEALAGTPTISINAPGTAGDISNQAMTKVDDTHYTYNYTVIAGTDGEASVTIGNAADAAGNAMGTPAGNTFSIDTTGSSVTLSYNPAPPVKAGNVEITATFSAPVRASSTPQISIDRPGGAGNDITNQNMTTSDPTRKVWKYTYNVLEANGTTIEDGTASVTITNGYDELGNPNDPATGPPFVIDTTRPVCSLSYNPGPPVPLGQVEIIATFNEPLTAGITPVVSIDATGSAGDVSNATMTPQGTERKVFKYVYTVVAGTDPLANVTVSQAFDRAGNQAINGLTGSFTIDTTAPGVQSVVFSPSQVIKGGVQITIDVIFNEAMNESPAPKISSQILGGSFEIQNATMTKISATQWRFSYTPSDSVSSNGTREITFTAKDLAGNSYTNPASGSRPWFVVDSKGPTITGCSVDPSSVTNALNDTVLTVTVNFEPERSGMNYSIVPTVTYTPNGGSPVPFVKTSWQSVGGVPRYIGTVTVPRTTNNGNATVQVSGATDNAGNVMTPNNSACTFMIDTHGPVASIRDPVSLTGGYILTQNDMDIVIDLSDDGTGVSTGTILLKLGTSSGTRECTIGGNPQTMLGTLTYASNINVLTYHPTTVFPEGTLNVWLEEAKDLVPHSLQSRPVVRVFCVDTTSPTATNPVPAPNSITTNAGVTPTVLIKDGTNGSGIRESSLAGSVTDASGPLDVTLSYNRSTGVFSIDPAQNLSDGTVSVWAFALDNSGKTAEITWKFYVDTKGPVSVLTSPLPNSTITNRRQIFIFQLYDLVAGVKTSSISLRVDDSSGSSIYNYGSGSNLGYSNNILTFTPSGDLADGTITLTVNATDNRGNTIQSPNSWNVTLDSTGPFASNFSPADGTVTGNTKQVVSVKIQDAQCSVDPSTIVIKANNVSLGTPNVTPGLTYDSGTKLLVFDPAVAGMEFTGSVTISLEEAKDSLGNSLQNKPVRWSFTVNTSGPVPANPYPRNISVKNNRQPVTVTVTPPPGTTIDASSIELKLTWVGGSSTYTTANAGLTFNSSNNLITFNPYNAGVTFGEGIVQVELLHARNNLGRDIASTYSWSFRVDTTPPSVSEMYPNGIFTNNRQQVITARLTDNLSGIDISSIYFRVSWAGGSRVFNVLGSGIPEILPSQGENQALTFSEETGILKFEPSEVTSRGTPSPLTFPPEGAVSVTILVSPKALADKAIPGGNPITTQVNWSFTVDTSGPVASNFSPASGAVVKDPDTVVSLKLSTTGASVARETILLNIENGGISTPVTGTAAGVNWNPATGIFSFKPSDVGITLDGGEVVVEIAEAGDETGNTLQNPSTWSYFIDNLGPAAVEYTPTDALVASKRPTIGFKLTDNKSGVVPATIKMRVSSQGRTDNITISTAGVTYSANGWFRWTPTFDLADGNVTVTLLDASDALGNTLQDGVKNSFSFRINTKGPIASNPVPYDNIGNRPEVTSNNQPLIQFDLKTLYSTINTASIRISLAGTGVPGSQLTYDSSAHAGAFTFGDIENGKRVTFDPGPVGLSFSTGQVNVAILQAKDALGNNILPSTDPRIGPQNTWYFIVDRTGPSVSNPSPYPNELLGSSSGLISFTIKDQYSAVDDSSIRVSINGSVYNPVSHTYDPDTGRYSFSMADVGANYTNGVNTIVVVQALDSLGNNMNSQYVWTVRVDLAPPVVSDMYPASNSVVRDREQVISCRITDMYAGVNPSTVKLKVNGATYTLASQALTFTPPTLVFRPSFAGLTFEDETVTVELVGGPGGLADMLGNTIGASVIWKFSVMSRGPSASNPQPADGAVVSNKQQIITLRLLSDKSQVVQSSIEFYVNGEFFNTTRPSLVYDSTTGLLTWNPVTEGITLPDGTISCILAGARDVVGNELAGGAFEWKFRVDTNGPTATLHTTPVSPEEPETMWITARLSEKVSTPPSLTMKNGDGSTLVLSLADVLSDGINWSAKVPFSRIIDPATFTYSGRDELGNVSTTISTPFTLQKSTLNSTREFRAGNWYMIGFPLTFTSRDISNVFAGTDMNGVIIWELDSSAGRYVNATKIKPGTGYMLYNGSNKSITLKSTGYVHNNPALYFQIPLRKGWNLFSVPYNFRVDWAGVKVRRGTTEVSILSSLNNLTDMNVWSYENDSGTGKAGFALGRPDTYLEPWCGYLIFAKENAVLLLPREMTDIERIANEPVPPKGLKLPGTGSGWSVKIQAECGRAVDGYNYFGMHESSRNGYDALDLVEPPLGVVSPSVSLYFPLNVNNVERYTSDFRSYELKSRSKWPMVVKSDVLGETIRLSWSLPSIPGEAGLTLYDQTTGEQVDMKSRTSYTFTYSGPRQFVILYNPPTVVASSSDTTRPRVISAYPTGYTVSPLTSICVTFSEPVYPRTVPYGISVSSSARTVRGTVSYDEARCEAVFRPERTLDASTFYSVVVSNSIMDYAGNELETFTWSFRTASVGAETVFEKTYPAGWNMISLPLYPSSSNPEEIFQAAGNHIKLLHYLSGSYQVYRKGVPTSIVPVSPGIGYWLYLPTQTAISIRGALADTSCDFKIPLKAQDWNQIGVPFNSNFLITDLKVDTGTESVSFEAAVAMNLVQGSFYGYSSRSLRTITAPQGTLEAGKAYFVYSFADCMLVFPKPSVSAPALEFALKSGGAAENTRPGVAATSKAGSKGRPGNVRSEKPGEGESAPSLRVDPEKSFVIPVSVTLESSGEVIAGDLDNFFGIDYVAADGADVLDLFELDAPPPSVSLYFKDRAGRKLAKDMRGYKSLEKGQITWKMILRPAGVARGKAVLNWDLSSLPSCCRLKLIDRLDGKEMDMREKSSLTVELSDCETEFEIILEKVE